MMTEMLIDVNNVVSIAKMKDIRVMNDINGYGNDNNINGYDRVEAISPVDSIVDDMQILGSDGDIAESDTQV